MLVKVVVMIFFYFPALFIALIGTKRHAKPKNQYIDSLQAC